MDSALLALPDWMLWLIHALVMGGYDLMPLPWLIPTIPM